MIAMTPDDLLSVASGGWGYVEAEWIDGWHLRAAEGFTHRANSAWPIPGPTPTPVLAPSSGPIPAPLSGPLSGPNGSSPDPSQTVPRALPQTLRAVHAWYAERDLPALVQCIVGSDLDYALVSSGHANAVTTALRQSAPLNEVISTLSRAASRGAGLSAAAAAPGTTPRITTTLEDRPDPNWLKLYRSGSLPSVASRVLGAGDPNVRFATVYEGDDATGTPLAIGRVVLAVSPGAAGPARWAGLTAIETAPAARRRGLAKLVIGELLAWAGERGATDAYLEVATANAPAIALYESLGFTTHHAYHYRVIESSAA
jgi:GNAT superfamily N-acetyltransferase